VRLATLPNRFGTLKARYRCGWCGCCFDVTPGEKPGTKEGKEQDDRWENCLDTECPSYNPKRDVMGMFGGD